MFQFYISAKMYGSEPRDELAVRELLRMCFEVKERYQLIVLAKNPEEISYKEDQVRHAGNQARLQRHALTRSFVEHFIPEKLYFVDGSLENRLAQVQHKLQEMGLTY